MQTLRVLRRGDRVLLLESTLVVLARLLLVLLGAAFFAWLLLAAFETAPLLPRLLGAAFALAAAALAAALPPTLLTLRRHGGHVLLVADAEGLTLVPESLQGTLPLSSRRSRIRLSWRDLDAVLFADTLTLPLAPPRTLHRKLVLLVRPDRPATPRERLFFLAHRTPDGRPYLLLPYSPACVAPLTEALSRLSGARVRPRHHRRVAFDRRERRMVVT